TDGGTTNASFALTITPANDPPTLDPINNLSLNEGAGPQTVNLTGISTGAANENQTLAVTATSSNPDLVPHPAVTYTSPNATGTLSIAQVVGTNGSAIMTITVNDGSNRTIRLNPLPNQSSAATITLSVTDSNNLTGTRTFTVIVTPVNHAPTLDTLADLLINEDAGQQTVNLTGITSGALNENQ